MKAIMKWSVAVLAALVLICGWGTIRSWAGYARASTQQAIEDAIPIDVQLGRLDQDVAGAEESIRECVRLAATAAFERDQAAERLEQLEDRRKGLLRDIAVMNEDLKKAPDRQKFVYDGREYGRFAVESDLRAKVGKAEVLGAHLQAQEKMVAIRSAGVANEEQKLASLAQRRSRLEIQSETLRAEYQHLTALDTAGKAGVDTSRLAEAEKLAAAIQRKLAISRKMIESGQLCDESGIRPVIVPQRSVTELADDLLYRVPIRE